METLEVSSANENDKTASNTTVKFEEYLEKLEEEKMKDPEYARRVASFNRIRDFEMLDEIGQGNFTTLFKVIEKKTQREFALKVAEKAKLVRMHKETDLVAERHCLMKLKDLPQVVRIEETFQDKENLYVLMELIKGRELWQMMNIFGFAHKSDAYHFFQKILEAVKEIHGRGIVHRDLKPENIMVSAETNEIKIIDFGSAKDIVEKVQSKGNSSTGRMYYEHFMGTPNYMAPECIHNKASDKASDIYSLGCVFYNLLMGLPPFLGGSDYLVFTAGLQKRISFYPGIFTREEADFIIKLLSHEPPERPTIEQALELFNTLKDNTLVAETAWIDLTAEEISKLIQKVKKCEEKMNEKEIETEITEVKERLKAKDTHSEFSVRIDDRVKLLHRQILHFFKHKTFEHYFLHEETSNDPNPKSEEPIH
jgi:serine/threonine protein kinase